MEFFTTIDQPSQAEFKDRGSKFLAHAFPISSPDEFKKQQQLLKKEHPKAVHYCFAYRLGLDGNQFRVSDDGEPAGTAGKPILGQIDSKGLTDIALIVVRYFGGTLLGVPGLINAYKTAASLALQVVPFIQKPVLKQLSLQFDYTQMNEVLILLRQMNAIVIRQENMLFSQLDIGVPVSRVEELLYRVKNLRNVEVLNLL
ncbi:MAG: YigZ family protein [Chitinophagaceae bacterium]|nr:MAG: YigZ family protein [Chitinophagaceae bacterium]